MKNPHKALEAIEMLVGGDFGMDMDFLLYDDREKNLDPRLKKAAEVITKIYCIAHSETVHSCSHEEWEKIKYDVIKENVEC